MKNFNKASLTFIVPNEANVYIKGNFTISKGKPQIEVSKVTLGNVPVQKSVLQESNINYVESFVSDLINGVSENKINNLTCSNGRLNIDGQMPQRLDRVLKSIPK